MILKSVLRKGKPCFFKNNHPNFCN